jgi:isocitrate dehydrogenase (NAD+)
MLNHIGETDAAARIQGGLLAVLATPARTTRDLGGSATTTEFADAICRALQSESPTPNPESRP